MFVSFWCNPEWDGGVPALGAWFFHGFSAPVGFAGGGGDEQHRTARKRGCLTGGGGYRMR